MLEAQVEALAGPGLQARVLRRDHAERRAGRGGVGVEVDLVDVGRAHDVAEVGPAERAGDAEPAEVLAGLALTVLFHTQSIHSLLLQQQLGLSLR